MVTRATYFLCEPVMLFIVHDIMINNHLTDSKDFLKIFKFFFRLIKSIILERGENITKKGGETLRFPAFLFRLEVISTRL